jgi:hypothetical protein
MWPGMFQAKTSKGDAIRKEDEERNADSQSFHCWLNAVPLDYHKSLPQQKHGNFA